MATVRKTGGTAGKQFKTALPVRQGASAAKRGDLGLSLPTELSTPIKSIQEALWLIYGEPGIGKTSLTTRFPGSMSLMFEPGGKGLAFHKRDVPTWKHFTGYVDLLIKSEFQMVCIDTVDKAYKKCFEHVCRVNGMTHPSDKAYGAGWTLVLDEFTKHFERLITAGKGIVFVSHVKDKAFQTRSGREYQKIVPSLSASAGEYVGGLVDVIGYYGYWGENRYLTIRGSDELEAKNRLKYRFRAKNGRRVHSIPMFSARDPDFDEENAFQSLERAFNNLQVNSGEPEEAVTLSNIVAKPKTRTKR